MSLPVVGVLIIGQGPRPDLVDPVRDALPGVRLIEIGALDDGSIPPERPAMRYPLTTRLRDGALVTVDEDDLADPMQRAAEQVEAAGATIALLACAGPFPDVRAGIPLVKPFPLAVAALHHLGVARIGVVCPTAAQEPGCRQKWTAAGFDPQVWITPSGSHQPDPHWIVDHATADRGIACVVLDYFGHPPAYAESVRAELPVPLVDLGSLAVATLATMVR